MGHRSAPKPLFTLAEESPAMRFTIWSNGGRHEWLLYDDGESIRARSGLIFPSRSRAQTDLRRYLKENGL